MQLQHSIQQIQLCCVHRKTCMLSSLSEKEIARKLAAATSVAYLVIVRAPYVGR